VNLVKFNDKPEHTSNGSFPSDLSAKLGFCFTLRLGKSLRCPCPLYVWHRELQCDSVWIIFMSNNCHNNL